jgi:glyoxylase-like metal-dependent hydrolase (beta-lactamase superfamily II)
MPTESWPIGDVTITKVVESENWVPLELLGEMLLPKSSRAEIEAMQWLAPHYVRDGQLSFGIYSFLVETPNRKLVVDTAVGNAKPRAGPNFNMLDTAYLDNFRDVWEPDDVDGVVSTHLHVDHVGWNTHLVDGYWLPTFTNATYHFVEQEYRHWKRYADNNDSVNPMFDAAVVFSDSVRPVVDAGLASFVEPSAHLTPEVALIPSHGHTPGHVSVLIESKGESAVITGDLMHTPCQIGRPDWRVPTTQIRRPRQLPDRPSWNASRTPRRWSSARISAHRAVATCTATARPSGLRLRASHTLGS